MTVSRARFKLALRYIKKHENQLRQKAIADAMCEKVRENFGKKLRSYLLIIFPCLLV